MPLFTIITATYNAAATLPRLLDSLAEQTCRDFELIIQDGASTDDTVAVAESYRDKLPALSLASEPDTGIYDAWNKALNRIRGEWVLFLGADDKLADRFVLEKIAKFLASVDEKVNFVSCDLIKTSQQAEDNFYFKLSNNPVKALRVGMPCGHPALFQRSNFFLHKKFSSKFKIAGDYDFLIRALKSNNQIVRFPLCATIMSGDGISSSPQTRYLVEHENRTIWKKYFYISYLSRTATLKIKKSIKKIYAQTIIAQYLFNATKKIYKAYFKF